MTVAPPPPPLSPSSKDLERGQHEHHGRPRTEALEAESGLLWDPVRKEWITDEEADGEVGFEEGESQVTAVVGGRAAGEVGEEKQEVVWMEWEVNDPDNPFWWSTTRKCE